MRGINCLGCVLLTGLTLFVTGCAGTPEGSVDGKPLSGYICEPGSFKKTAPNDVLKPNCQGITKADYATRDVVVFVHGLGGNSISTWHHPDQGLGKPGAAYWPDLVRQDAQFRNLDVYSFGYRTGIIGSQPYMFEVVTEMKQHLIAAGITDHRRVYFVVHSLGGIMTRNYLMEFTDLEGRASQIQYFGTPGAGSGLSQMLPFIGSVQTLGLTPSNDDSSLTVYRRMWKSLDTRFGRDRPKTKCACETQSMFPLADKKLLVVEKQSCEAMCDSPADVVDIQGVTHLTLVKPENHNSQTYVVFAKELAERIEFDRKEDLRKAQANAPKAPTVDIAAAEATCPAGTEQLIIDPSKPYGAALTMYLGDSIVLDQSSSLVVPVAPVATLRGFEPLSVATQVSGCKVLETPEAKSGIRYLHTGIAPAVIRFADQSAIDPNLLSYRDSGVVKATVFKSPRNSVARKVEPFIEVRNIDDPLPPTSTGDRTVAALPVCLDLKQALTGSWECTGYSSDVAFFRTGKQIVFKPGQISHDAFNEVEQLQRLIATGEVKALVIRGFASPDPLSCNAWRNLLGASKDLDDASKQRFRSWACADKDPNANGNALLSAARAEKLKSKLTSHFPNVQLVALGCGDRYARGSSYATQLRGVVLEARKVRAAEETDSLLGCRISS